MQKTGLVGSRVHPHRQNDVCWLRARRSWHLPGMLSIGVDTFQGIAENYRFRKFLFQNFPFPKFPIFQFTLWDAVSQFIFSQFTVSQFTDYHSRYNTCRSRHLHGTVYIWVDACQVQYLYELTPARCNIVVDPVPSSLAHRCNPAHIASSRHAVD